MGADYYADYESAEKPLKKSKDHEEASLWRTCLRLWRPLTAVFLYWNMQCERSDLTGAFLRSNIECAPVVPNPKTGLCPRGSIARDGACEALPPGHKQWSGSSKCGNGFLVVARATAIGGQMSSCSTICSLVAQIFVGSMLVDSWGRKPVMLIGLSGSMLCSTLFFVACFVNSHMCLQLMFVGVALFSLSNAFPAAALAMASDLSRSDMVGRGMSYTAIFILQHVGICTAYVAGFMILAMDLTHYAKVWGIFLCVCVAIVVVSAFLLRETLGSENAGEAEPVLGGSAEPRVEASWEEAHGIKAASPKDREGRGCTQRAVSEAVMAFRLVWRDPFLRLGMILTFLANAAATGAINITGGYAISVVGLTQAVASLAGVFQPAAIVCGSSFSTGLLNTCGPYVTYFLGFSLVSVGMVITGLAATAHASAEALFWTGWVIVGIGWGVGAPSHSAFNSMRVPDKNDHGKLFAAINFVSAIGSTVGSLVWTNYIFSGHAVETHRGGLGYYCSAVIVACVVAGYALLYLCIIRPEERLKLQEKQHP